MKELYVLVVGGSNYYYQPFRNFGRYSSKFELLNKPENISLVLFTGGADINPSLYGHKKSRLTYCDTHRDIYELMAFRLALRHNLPMAGVCRGAQFLCAMAGGSLYQHVTHHDRGRHDMATWDGRHMQITSTHHQMQKPPDDAIILGWADPNISTTFIEGEDQEVMPPEYEYECVYYPNINAVGMQYHPEMMSEHSPGFRLAEELVDTWVLQPQSVAA